MVEDAVIRTDGRDKEPMPQGFSIAIDGPVASGKGTLAQALADRLGGFNLNTGAMYRSVALFAKERGIDINQEPLVALILPEASITFQGGQVFLNGTDVTERIKEPDISLGSSRVATYGSVRENLVGKQRQMAREAMEKGQMVVVEGRDIGKRVLPDASIKIFLTARPEVRAKRRLAQYLAKGIAQEEAQVLADIHERDSQDANRAIDPLPMDNPERFGYWLLDDSDQTEEQTIHSVMQELTKRGLIND